MPATLRTRICLLALVLWASGAAAQTPAFSKAFSPSTIGPGSVSTLTFTIANVEILAPVDAITPAVPVNVTDMAFTDTLPAGVVIATPARASTTCTNGLVTAPAGGGTITFSDGRLIADATCTVTVNVTSSTVGGHVNTSGALTSSAGTSGTATATLTVSDTIPGFTKSFSPNPVTVGQTSVLTFTIESGSSANSLAFTDSLPAGMVVATPANASTTCGGSLTATPGASSISLSFGTVAGEGSCTIQVTVVTTAAGALGNTTGNLTSSLGSSGMAAAVLTVNAGFLLKTFTDDPIAPGQTVTLQFTITNSDRDNAASNIAFTDDLGAALTGLAATGLPLADPCGPGSQLTGTTLLTLTGGSLAAEASCTFSVTLQVPSGAAAGSYVNTTSQPTALIGGVTLTKPAASDTLIVAPVAILTKSFTNDPVVASGSVTLQFTITNGSSSASATDIAFSDDLGAMGAGHFLVAPAVGGFCGAGSTMAVLSGGLSEPVINVAGASLVAGGACTFSATLTVNAGASAGTYTNTTGPIAATVDSVSYQGKTASDTLVVAGAPALTKQFTDDPVLPGGTVTLEFTLTLGANATTDATEIAFTDDLNAALSGLAATGLPATNICGSGSQMAGTTSLTFTNGTLSPGTSCTFSVTLQVPAGAVPGAYTNTTSSVTAKAFGQTVTGSAASDDLDVAGLSLTKSFTNDPAVPGGTVTLRFTVSNTSAFAATAIAFTDDLTTVLTDLTATGLPAAVCGGTLSGTTSLTFSGGSLAAGASCTIDVTLQVPTSATVGEYNNVTSSVTATINATGVTVPGASDGLTVQEAISLTKAFTDDPVPPGGTVTLRFTIANNNPMVAATGIAFTDDLNAALSGLAATGLPAAACGGTIGGTTLLSFTGGTLAGGASCTFSVTVQVPAAVAAGTLATNTTSTISATFGATLLTGQAATDTLRIDTVAFTKAFSGAGAPAGSVTLTFTLQNLSETTPIGRLSFQDNLGAVLSGLAATGLPASDVCGAGSSLTGTSTIVLTNGTLAAGGTCTINVTVQIPASTLDGTYTNTSGDLFSGGIEVASAVSATLTVAGQADLSIVKADSPDPVYLNGALTYTITVNNLGPHLAPSVVVTDTPPAGVTFVSTSGCLEDPAGTPTCTLGDIAAGASKQYTIAVTAGGPGAVVNQASVTSPRTDPVPSNNSTTETTTIIKYATTTTITSDAPDPSLVGETVTVAWNVAIVAPGVGTPTGTVTVLAPGGETCTAAVAAGQCTLVFTTAGLRTLTATYSGDATFSGSAGTTPHQVNCPTITIEPVSLPQATRGIPYSATFTASGGLAPYAFIVSSGSLPPGLTLAGAALAGTPTTAGFSTFLITATDARSCTGARSYFVGVDQLTLGFGEGAFGTAFSSYLMLLNPTATPAPAELALQFEGSAAEIAKVTTVPATTRVTLPLAAAATLPDGTRAPAPTAVSSTVTSAAGGTLVAEEATYFSEGSPFTGGTRIVARAPGLTHYFAEGTEKPADFGSGPVDFFDTYLLVGNDNDAEAWLDVKFLREPPLPPITRTFVVPGNARLTIPIAARVPVLAGESFGVAVTSSVPISMTRSTYFGMPPTFVEAHASEGVANPSQTHLFAEGATTDGFDVFYLIANPGDAPATVTLTHHLTTGATVVQSLTLPAESRGDVHVNGAPGGAMSAAEFWTSVTATQPVAVERSMYLPGAVPIQWVMATSSPGLAQAATKLAFAEGVVGGTPGFQTFLLIANPDTIEDLALNATYVRETGATVIKSYVVPAGTRATIWANVQVPELSDEAFGVVLESTNGVAFVAEESVYWNDLTGGATTVGTPIP